MMRLGASFLAALALTAATAVPAAASAILLGDTITFELLDDGVGLGTLTDTKLIAAAGDGIEAGDSSNIGGAMFEGEFIRVFETSISFSLFGGADDVPGFPGYRTTGFGPDARYVLSGLFAPGVAEITAVSITLSNVVNVVLGLQVLFDAGSVTLFLGNLGILESSSNLGQVTLGLTVTEIEDPGPAPVPEPGTLLLLGSGVAAAVWIRRRSSGKSSARNVPLS